MSILEYIPQQLENLTKQEIINESCFNICPQLSVKNCFIRGSVIRYVQLPAEDIDTALLQDATRKEAQQGKQ